MVSRFQRRGAPPEVTFFVFQDILTSMIGILIIVTLALALQTDEPDDPVEIKRSEVELSQKLEQALAQVSNLKAKFESFGMLKGSAPSTVAIGAEEASLRSQIAVYGQSNEQRQQTAQKLGSHMIDSDLAGEIKGMGMMLQKSELQRDGLKAISDEKQRQLAKAEEEVRAAEAALLAEKNRQNVLRLIPEISGTTKEPVLVEVEGTGYKITRFDTQGEVSHGVQSDFSKGLGLLKPADQFVVFFFKPSAAGLFDAYLQKARSAGFEVGYDVVGEDMNLEFHRR